MVVASGGGIPKGVAFRAACVVRADSGRGRRKAGTAKVPPPPELATSV